MPQAAMFDRREPASTTRPVVLAIGGFDPSGGAGILADVRAIAVAGAHPTALVTAATVQSTAGCGEVAPVEARLLRAQLERLVAAQPPDVVKLGALGDRATAEVVAAFLASYTGPVFVDPVATASRHAEPGHGHALATPEARAVLVDRIIPRGVVVCANAPELAALSGLPCTGPASAEVAAHVVLARGARAVLAKGGHWTAGDATDLLVLPKSTHALPAPRLDASDVHGTGCTLASLAAGRLAMSRRADDASLVEAVRWAKAALTLALTTPVVVGEGQRVVRLESP